MPTTRTSTRAYRAAAKVGGLSRRDDPDALDDARRDLAEAKIHDAIERSLASSPPLRPEQRDRLTALLHATPAA